MGLFSPPKNSEWCLLPSLWSCLLKQLILSFGLWLFVTKPSFMLPYMRGNRKAGTIDWSFFEFHRSQMLKLHIWFFAQHLLWIQWKHTLGNCLQIKFMYIYITKHVRGLLVWAHYSSHLNYCWFPLEEKSKHILRWVYLLFLHVVRNSDLLALVLALHSS